MKVSTVSFIAAGAIFAVFAVTFILTPKQPGEVQAASDPMERQSYFDAFQPDSTFRVKSLENLTGNGLTRAVVERSDGYIFSALVVRTPGPDVSDRVLMVGDRVELNKLSYPLSGFSGSHGIPVEIYVIRYW